MLQYLNQRVIVFKKDLQIIKNTDYLAFVSETVSVVVVVFFFLLSLGPHIIGYNKHVLSR